MRRYGSEEGNQLRSIWLRFHLPVPRCRAGVAACWRRLRLSPDQPPIASDSWSGNTKNISRVTHLMKQTADSLRMSLRWDNAGLTERRIDQVAKGLVGSAFHCCNQLVISWLEDKSRGWQRTPPRRSPGVLSTPSHSTRRPPISLPFGALLLGC
jgi:hypothetical protein